jgi:hypothetical protein
VDLFERQVQTALPQFPLGVLKGREQGSLATNQVSQSGTLAFVDAQHGQLGVRDGRKLKGRLAV